MTTTQRRGSFGSDRESWMDSPLQSGESCPRKDHEEEFAGRRDSLPDGWRGTWSIMPGRSRIGFYRSWCPMTTMICYQHRLG
jgi:hypothetical protein